MGVTLNMIFISIILIMGILIFIMSMRTIYTKKKLQEISHILEDISRGNINHKILVRPNEITSLICYQINEIVERYHDRFIEYEKAEETNKQLMTSLSHDIRTPLTTLIGYLDAIQRKIVSGREREEYIDIARKKAHDIKRYIDVLFEWFKLNSNEETFAIETVEILELTRNLLKDWIPVFEEKGLVYNIDIPQKRKMTTIDVNAYSRVINNIIQNVLVHSNASKIDISILNLSDKVGILITDNGRGISAEDLKHIFERLYKCDPGRSKKGSGLGLNIAKQLIEKMGGDIFVNSKQSKYTTFSIFLPLND